MTHQELRGLFDLAKERDQKLYAWLRHVVLLASGALTVLVSLRAGTETTGLALVFLRVAWVALGSGILLGAISLHGEVYSVAELARQLGQQLAARPSDSDEPLSPVFASLPARYKWSARLCYVSLVVAVISLVAYAIVRS